MLKQTKTRLTPLLLIGSAFAAGACASVEEEGPPELRNEEEIPQVQAGEEVVEVSLETNDITLSPETVEPGTIVFRVSNDSGDEYGRGVNHDFVLEPARGNWEKEILFTLDPGNQEDFEVELEPGVYTVFCTVGDHSESGELATLAVGDVSRDRSAMGGTDDMESDDDTGSDTDW